MNAEQYIAELEATVEQLTRELADSAVAMNAENDRHIEHIRELEAENAKLREALKEYANVENWRLDMHSTAPHSYWAKDWYKNLKHDERPWRIAEAALREEKK